MTKRMTEWRCIGIVSGAELTMFGAANVPVSRMDIDGKEYREAGTGDFGGFYDWLRTSRDHIIGVRFLPTEENEFVLKAFARLPHATILREGGVEFLFTQDVPIGELSDDQAFGGNRIFVETGGEAIVTFSMHDLSETERRSIREARARWVTSTSITE